MPSASNNMITSMSQLVRDTYQANGLVGLHQHAGIASSQTSLQKLSATSPQLHLYQQLGPSNNSTSNSNSATSANNNNSTNSNNTQQQSMQFNQQALAQAQQNASLNKAADQFHNPIIVPQMHQQHLNNLALNTMSHQHQQQQHINGMALNTSTLTSQPPILMTSMMSSKNGPLMHQQLNSQNYMHHHQHLNQHHPHHQQQQQQQQQMIVSGQQHNQQQVPMTTIMIPAAAASQLQSVSMQIQQAALQSSPQLQQTPQILVFMIPYMVNPQGASLPSIPVTPEHSSLNSTLVRQSHSNSSMMRQSHPQHQQQHSQQHQQQQLQQQQQQQPSMTQANQTNNSIYNRTTSSLSNNQGGVKQEAEKFYVKANFSYRATRNRQELSFQKGDILHVLDTLQNNDYGVQYWLATRVNANGEDVEKGLIPNKNKAEEIAIEQRTMDIGEQGAGNTGTLDGASSSGGTGGVLNASVGRVNFLKRRSAQRSKSLCKDNWDHVVFDIGNFRLPVYDRVVFKHPGFCRPVVIFGPLADLAREKLLKDYPEKYSYPTGMSNQSPDHPKVIRLKGVLDVIDQGKHALLDITAQAVEKLNHVNLAPIVIYMKTESKSIIKEFRSRAVESLDPSARDNDTLRRDAKSSRKLLELSIKLEKQWSHVFTAILDLSTMGSEMWYRKLREIIENQQSTNVWMGDKRSSDKRQHSSSGTTNGSNATNQQPIYSTSSNSRQSNHSQNSQHAQQLQQSQSCIADSSSVLSEKFNESLNLTSAKSTNDLLPMLSSGLDNAGLYGNRSQLRNAYAHSLAQKLARASSEPKLNGLMAGGQEDEDDEEDDDITLNGRLPLGHDGDDNDDDDECIKKPLFPNEYTDNTSSISSSNGIGGNCSTSGAGASFGQYSLPSMGPSAGGHVQLPYQQQMASSMCQQFPPPPPLPVHHHHHHQHQHQQTQTQTQQQTHQVKPPAPLPPQAIAAAAAAALAANATQEQQQQSVAAGVGSDHHGQQQHHSQLSANRSTLMGQEAIYSMNAGDPSLAGVHSSYGSSGGSVGFAVAPVSSQQHHRDYHTLPPLAAVDNGYSNGQHQHHQQHGLQQVPPPPPPPPTVASGNATATSSTANGATNANSSYTSAPPSGRDGGNTCSDGTNSNTNGTGGANMHDLLARNHADARAGAYHIYSDMNQNNYHYYSMNKI